MTQLTAPPVFCVHCGKSDPELRDGLWAHDLASCENKKPSLPYRFCKNCGGEMPDVPGCRNYVHDECLKSRA